MWIVFDVDYNAGFPSCVYSLQWLNALRGYFRDLDSNVDNINDQDVM